MVESPLWSLGARLLFLLQPGLREFSEHHTLRPHQLWERWPGRRACFTPRAPNLAARRRRPPSASNCLPPGGECIFLGAQVAPPSMSCTQEDRASPTCHLSLQVSEKCTLTQPLKRGPPRDPKEETSPLRAGPPLRSSYTHGPGKEPEPPQGPGADCRAGRAAMQPHGAGLSLCLGHGDVPPV